MNRKKIVAALTSLVMILTCFAPISFVSATTADAPTEVYTKLTSNSETVLTGDGTKESPYNQFEAAVANVTDGGTVYVIGEAFANGDEAGRLPMVIDKDVTVMPADGAGYAELEVRDAGIVLGGDVTFKNIQLNFTNKYHNSIYANGHKLNLINVSQGSGVRTINLFAGGLNFTGDYTNEQHEWPVALPASGTDGSITVKADENLASGEKCVFGNIYGGSMNGTFGGDSVINISRVNANTLTVGDIYACGAVEVSAGNIFDDKEPETPMANADTFATAGNVEISIDKATIQNIYGDTGTETGETCVSVSTEYTMSNTNLTEVAEIEVLSGAFQPAAVANTGDFSALTVKNGAELDLSCGNDWSVTDFNGGGTLTLYKDGSLNVAGKLTGQTKLQMTSEGSTPQYDGSSGDAEPEHTYITSAVNGDSDSFTFTPNYGQYMYYLEYAQGQNSKTWTINKEVIQAESIRLSPEQNEISSEEINDNKAEAEFGAELTFKNEIANEFSAMDVPFRYTIKEKNTQQSYQADSVEGELGYYALVPEYNMMFEMICVESDTDAELYETYLIVYRDYADGSGEVPAGEYEITVEDPNAGAKSNTVTLTVSASYDLSDAGTKIELSEESYKYDGSAKTPEVTVTAADGTVLTKDVDYTVEYKNNVSVGAASVIVTGIGRCRGSAEIQFTIIVNDSVDKLIVTMLKELEEVPATLDSYYDTAELIYELLPDKVSVLLNNGAEEELNLEWNCTDYNVKPGTSNTFVWEAQLGSYETADGVAITGEVVIVNKAASSVNIEAANKAIDYCKSADVSQLFEFDVNAGEPTYKLVVEESTGKGELEGSQLSVQQPGVFIIEVTTAEKGNFASGTAKAALTVGLPKINQVTPPETADRLDKYYASAQDVIETLPQTVTVSTELGDREMAVSWYCQKYNSAPDAVNTFEWVVNEADYTDFDINENEMFGTVDIKNIETAEISTNIITLSASAFTYDGKAKSPAVTVRNTVGKVLVNGTNYTVSYKNNVNAGNATVVITGKGSYTGTAAKTFRINPARITSAYFSATAYTYDGKVKTPNVTAKAGGTVLANRLTKSFSNANVNVSYPGGRKNPGTYRATVTGKGNYTGTVTAAFNINVKPTSISKLSKGRKSFKVKWKKQSSKYITGYQIRYSLKSNMKSAKTSTVKKYKTTSKTIKKLKSKKYYYVQVRTYKKAGGKNYYSAWSSVKKVKTK